jgi:HTH-type transcriptional regulator, glycine betaine synthesis regulator
MSDLDPTMQAVHDSMIDGLGQLADYFGFNRVMGQLYGALLLSPEPLSLDDLVNNLGKSKANVSMNMQNLEHMGIVREVWVRDTRKKYYEAETDMWKILTNVLGSRELRDIDRALDVLERNIDTLRQKMPTMGDDKKTLAQYYMDRIDQVSDFFKFARMILTSILEYGRNFDVNEIIESKDDLSED